MSLLTLLRPHGTVAIILGPVPPYENPLHVNTLSTRLEVDTMSTALMLQGLSPDLDINTLDPKLEVLE